MKLKLRLVAGVLLMLALSLMVAAAELVARQLRGAEIDRSIGTLEAVVASNASYPRRGFIGYGDRLPEAEEHFDAWSRIPTVYRPYIEWRRAPGFHQGGINTNSLSYRGPEFEIEKPENVYRILVYGGSFVWGTGALTDEETIAGHLATILEGPQGLRVEVINAGESNYNTSIETVYLMIEGLFLDPDLVIFVDGVNDTASGYESLPAGYPGNFSRMNDLLTGQTTSKRDFFTVDTELEYWRRQRALVWTLPNWELLRRLAVVGDRFTGLGLGTGELPEFTTPEEYALRHSHNIKVVEALAQSFGFQTLFAIQPVPVLHKPLHKSERDTLDYLRRGYPVYFRELGWWQDHYDAYADRVIGLASLENVDVVDLRRIFEADDEPRYIDDCHLTGEGYRIIAEALADVVRDRNLLALPEP